MGFQTIGLSDYWAFGKMSSHQGEQRPDIRLLFSVIDETKRNDVDETEKNETKLTKRN